MVLIFWPLSFSPYLLAFIFWPLSLGPYLRPLSFGPYLLALIFWPLSFDLYLLALIFRPLSFGLYLSTFIFWPLSFDLYLLAFIFRPLSFGLYLFLLPFLLSFLLLSFRLSLPGECKVSGAGRCLCGVSDVQRSAGKIHLPQTLNEEAIADEFSDWEQVSFPAAKRFAHPT